MGHLFPGDSLLFVSTMVGLIVGAITAHVTRGSSGEEER